MTAALVADVVFAEGSEGGTNLSAEASAKAEVPPLRGMLELVRPDRFDL